MNTLSHAAATVLLSLAVSSADANQGSGVHCFDAPAEYCSMFTKCILSKLVQEWGERIDHAPHCEEKHGHLKESEGRFTTIFR